MRLTRTLSVVLLAACAFPLAAACPAAQPQPLPLLPGRDVPDPTPRARPEGPSLTQELAAIGDRLEDCAVERNVSLARRYAAPPTDLEAARTDAMAALSAGVVRRWWQQRILPLRRPEIQRIHACLKHQACDPFFDCSRLSDLFVAIKAGARPRPTGSQPAAR